MKEQDFIDIIVGSVKHKVRTDYYEGKRKNCPQLDYAKSLIETAEYLKKYLSETDPDRYLVTWKEDFEIKYLNKRFKKGETYNWDATKDPCLSNMIGYGNLDTREEAYEFLKAKGRIENPFKRCIDSGDYLKGKYDLFDLQDVRSELYSYCNTLFFEYIKQQLFSGDYRINHDGDEISFIEKMHQKYWYPGLPYYTRVKQIIDSDQDITNKSNLLYHCENKLFEINKNGCNYFLDKLSWNRTDCCAELVRSFYYIHYYWEPITHYSFNDEDKLEIETEPVQIDEEVVNQIICRGIMAYLCHEEDNREMFKIKCNKTGAIHNIKLKNSPSLRVFRRRGEFNYDTDKIFEEYLNKCIKLLHELDISQAGHSFKNNQKTKEDLIKMHYQEEKEFIKENHLLYDNLDDEQDKQIFNEIKNGVEHYFNWIENNYFDVKKKTRIINGLKCSKDLSHLEDLFNYLIEKEIIHKDSEKDHFFAIFKDEEINDFKKIKWILNGQKNNPHQSALRDLFEVVTGNVPSNNIINEFFCDKDGKEIQFSKRHGFSVYFKEFEDILYPKK